MRVAKTIFILTFILSLTVLHNEIKAGSLYKEINIIGGYSDLNKSVGKDNRSLKNSIGFEYYDKFSDQYGDYLTADLQVRLAYDSLKNSNDAWALEVHNAFLDYKLGLGKALRVGHFDPSFGLEPVLDTHGTLFQTLARKNIGFKKDWGTGIRGILGEFDYELSAQIGSGMGIERKDGSFLLSSRLGTAQDRDFQYGISLLYGEVLASNETKTIPAPELISNQAILKKRIGLDGQYSSGPYLLKGELVYGQDSNDDILGSLLEVDYVPRSIQELEFKLQGQFFSKDLGNSNLQDIIVGAGLGYKLNSDLTLRLAYFHDFRSSSVDKDRQVLLQVYYYGL